MTKIFHKRYFIKSANCSSRKNSPVKQGEENCLNVTLYEKNNGS